MFLSCILIKRSKWTNNITFYVEKVTSLVSSENHTVVQINILDSYWLPFTATDVCKHIAYNE